MTLACGLAPLLACGSAAGQPPKPFVGPPHSPEGLKVLHTLGNGKDILTGVAFSPDSRILAVSEYRGVRFYDPATGKETQPMWAAEDTAQSVTFLDGQTLGHTLGGGDLLLLRHYPSGREVGRIELGKFYVCDWIASPGVVVTGENGATGRPIRGWIGPEWTPAWCVELSPGDITWSLTFSPDRKEVAVGTEDGRVRVYQVSDGKMLRSADRDKLGLRGAMLAYHPNGRELAIGTGSGFGTEAPDDELYGLDVWDAGLTKRCARLRWGAAGVRGSTRIRTCMYTPDGKTLLIVCDGPALRVYETETWGLRHVGKLPEQVTGAVLSPDGKFLAALGSKRLRVIDWRMLSARSDPMNDNTRDAAWKDLGSLDSAIGFGAIRTLCKDSASSTAIFKDRLKPVPIPDTAAVKRLVADLGSEDFAVREAAEASLAKFGDAVVMELRVGAKSEQPERRARAEKLLRLAERRGSSDRLRYLRAVEVLEYTATAEAREVLKSLAGGAPNAYLTRDAASAMRRLGELSSQK